MACPQLSGAVKFIADKKRITVKFLLNFPMSSHGPCGLLGLTIIYTLVGSPKYRGWGGVTMLYQNMIH
jgi:hypothetical protein